MAKVRSPILAAGFLALVVLVVDVAHGWATAGFAQVSAPVAENPRIVPELLRADFHLLRTALEEGDSGIYRYVSKEKMDAIFDTAYAKIDHPMDALEFFRITAPVVAAVKCGHTSIRLPADIERNIETQVPLFPAEVRILGDKTYVLRDLATDDGRLNGAEILSINGLPASQILKTVKTVFHGDGNTATAGAFRLSHRQSYIIALYTIAAIRSPFHLTYRSLGGEIATIDFQGTPLQSIKETLQRKFPGQNTTEPIAQLNFLDQDKIAVLKVTKFNSRLGGANSQLVTDFYKQSFQQIRSRGSDSLILDLRDNGGGEDDLGKFLFSYLTTQPFRYYDDLVANPQALKYLPQQNASGAEDRLEKWPDGKLHNVAHPNWGMQQPSQPTFNGKVYVLMNGGSFSTTCEFLSTLHFHHRATFIGEEVGGAYYGNTSGMGASVTLPNSHLVLGLRMLTYYLAVKGYPADRGVLPDYPVEYSIRDVLAGTDKYMAEAMELIREDRKPSSASGN